MAKERDERLYLADIRDAIDRILRYTATGREAFFADSMIQDAVVRNIRMVFPMPTIRPSTVALNDSRSNAILRPARAPRSVPYIQPATAATMWSSVDAIGGPSVAP